MFVYNALINKVIKCNYVYNGIQNKAKDYLRLEIELPHL